MPLSYDEWIAEQNKTGGFFSSLSADIGNFARGAQGGRLDESAVNPQAIAQDVYQNYIAKGIAPPSNSDILQQYVRPWVDQNVGTLGQSPFAKAQAANPSYRTSLGLLLGTGYTPFTGQATVQGAAPEFERHDTGLTGEAAVQASQTPSQTPSQAQPSAAPPQTPPQNAPTGQNLPSGSVIQPPLASQVIPEPSSAIQTQQPTRQTTLADIFKSRSDLQKAFGPNALIQGTQANRQLNDWWNQHGVTEYPGTKLTKPSLAGATPQELAGARLTPRANLLDPMKQKADDALSQYGVAKPDSTKNPLTSFGTMYKSMLDALGFSSIKTRVDDINKQYAQLQNEQIDKIQSVNDNPWLSESSRQRQINSIKEKYEMKLSALDKRLSVFSDLEDDVRNESQFVANQAMDAYYKERTLDQNLLIKKMELAEKHTTGTADIQEYEYAKKQGYKGLFIDWQRENANLKSKAEGETKLLTPTEASLFGVPYGTTQAEAFGKTPIKPPTDAQSITAGYAARLEQSEPTLKNVEKDIVGMNVLNFEAQVKLPAALQSETVQLYMQASRNFINAVLRRESGAVISPSEFTNARQQYLPQPGDSQATLNLKSQNRATVLNSLVRSSGAAYSPLPEINAGNLILQVDEDIKNLSGNYGNREQLLSALIRVYPELTESELAGRVYTLIPDKK